MLALFALFGWLFTSLSLVFAVLKLA